MSYSNSTKDLKVLALAGAISAALLSGYPAGAEAGIAAGWERSSHVEDNVIDNTDGTWSYDFTVFNDSVFDSYGTFDEPFIIDWELPFFGDMGITDIVQPGDWFANIETIGVANPATGWDGVAAWQTPGDPWKAIFDGIYGSAAANPFNDPDGQVLHWYTDALPCGGGGPSLAAITTGCIGPGESLAGFGFDAEYEPGQAPYQASWFFQPVQTGDPAFPAAGLPNSQSMNPIPLPGAAILFSFGLAGLAGVARRKRSRRGV